MRLVALGVLGTILAGTAMGRSSLQQAIAQCDVGRTRLLLDRGADPNALDASGHPVIRWLASGSRCHDDDALEIAKLLDGHAAKFDASAGSAGPSLLVNLASRHLPKTLAFLATKHAGDPTEALRAIARRDDLDSIRALLDAGADPLAGVARSSSLLDAAEAGRDASVAEMMKHAGDKESPKVIAARDYAAKKGDQKVLAALESAGVAPPTTPTPNPCEPTELSANEKALLGHLGLPNASGLAGLAGAPVCKHIQSCGDLVLIDCNSAADGPAYYLDTKTETRVSTCGGACMRGCKDACPPKTWTCECVR